MALNYLDIAVIVVFLLVIFIIGISYKNAGSANLTSFFLGGRNLPWWLAGLSMVATTFAADTPLAVTELVGNNGISGNWLWWNLLAGGMLTTFFFANLWRRANILTEVEFIEIRYSGKPAAYLRGFKAIYLGLVMNMMVIGWVNLAMVTILQGFFGISSGMALLYTGLMMVIVAIYTSVSGLMGVVVTDAVQFIVAMTGSILLAIYVVNSPDVGGIANLKASLPTGATDFLPSLSGTDGGNGLSISIATFLAFFGFVWWASWYPGAEPGGGGYIAQRMMSTKNEKHAVGATLFFQVAHYCLRPWPWIIVGLCAVVVFSLPRNIENPQLRNRIELLAEEKLPPSQDKVQYILADAEVAQLIKLEKTESKKITEAITYTVNKRFGYIYAMKNYLPNGLLGLLLAAFFAAYMSTISTQLNWGASYLVNDGYHRYLNKKASQKQLIFASRVATIGIMVLGLAITSFIDSISAVWQFIMECGAGLGMVLILRWYWWRINAWAEIAATLAPFVGYAIAHYVLDWVFPNSFFFTVGLTTVSWVVVMYLTPPENDKTLGHFYNRILPDGWWKPVKLKLQTPDKKSNMLPLAACWISAVAFTYALLFFMGKLILQEYTEMMIAAAVAIFSLLILLFFIRKTRIFS